MQLMPLKEPSFTIGIEEEYLLVDRTSRDLVCEMPSQLFEDCDQALRGQVAREFLKSQIEVETQVHRSVCAAGAELKGLRRTVADLAGRHGLAPIAASTHPFARSRPPSGSGTGPSPRTSPASAAAWCSAACTCMWASTTTSCASTC
jgi:gamma-glutamyl:cysteine ligase YbdK (ATP-grasp superfamily)